MKKKLNILLLCAVLGIWGSVIYKLARNYFFPGNDAIEQPMSFRSEGIAIKAKDTFELENLPYDPFKGRAEAGKKLVRHTPVSTVRKPPPPKIPKLWPKVKYYGFIKSNADKGKSELVLIEIGGVLKKMRRGESLEEVTLKKVYSDSVELARGKERKVIGKE